MLALTTAIVAPADRLKIRKSIFCLSSDITSKEATLQVVYDVLKLTPFYKAFQVTADAPGISYAGYGLCFVPHFGSIVGNKKFVDPPLESEIIIFLASLGHTGDIRKLSDVNVNKLHQPWRSFAAVINKCLCGTPSYDSLRLSQAQILWGMYNKKNVDYAYLLWEDFIFKIETKSSKKGSAMYYPRFTKLVVNYVMEKDPSIPRRNKVNWHYARDDPMFSTINYSKYYLLWASGTILLRTMGSKKKANTDAIPKPKSSTAPKKKKSGTGKQKTSELENISEAELTEAEQLKIVLKRSRLETHSSHASGSGADEGTGITPGVPDAPDYDSDDDISWKSSDDDQDDEQDQDDDDAEKMNDDDKKTEDDDDEEMTESDNDGDDFVHPKLTTHEDEIIHEKDTDEDDSTFVEPSSPRLHTASYRHSPTTTTIMTPATTYKLLVENLPNFARCLAVIIAESISDIQSQLYQSLVDSYEDDKILLDKYGDKSTIKKSRDGAVEDQEHSMELIVGQREEGQDRKTASYSATVKRQTRTAGQIPIRDVSKRLQTGSVLLFMKLSKLVKQSSQPRPREHRLIQLPLVPNSQVVVSFHSHHFITTHRISSGGVSSRIVLLSVTKTRLQITDISMVEDWCPNRSGVKRSNQLEMSISKRRIIAVTKFKEGELQDLGSRTLKLAASSVQGKWTNLSVEERIAFNVFTMFTEEFSSSDFSDGTLDDVRTVLNDRLKGIRIEYLPETFWSQRDKANARAMIQAIDKRLKTRRIMEEIEKIVRWTTLRGYKAVRLRFSDPMIQPEPEGSTQGYPLVSVDVLSSDNVNMSNPHGFEDFRYSDTTHLSRSVKVLMLKNFKKDATLKLFKNGMSMSVQMSQVHKMARFIRWRRDCAWLMISRGSRSLCQIQVQGTSSIQEVNDHYNIFTRERQEYELKTKDKA
ncbi:hypothetical protein Tco_1315464 [Tanacetum coccineum]